MKGFGVQVTKCIQKPPFVHGIQISEGAMAYYPVGARSSGLRVWGFFNALGHLSFRFGVWVLGLFGRPFACSERRAFR